MAVSQRPKLSFLDRFLPVWIILAMAAGLLIGHFIPGIGQALGAVEIGGISIPIAIGLLVMMYPPLAKVRYEKTKEIATDGRLMAVSLVLNWLVGPAFMFTLAWLFLADQPELRTGLIIVGLARCIAMVLVWSDLSCADREATAVLVALNSILLGALSRVWGEKVKGREWFENRFLPAVSPLAMIGLLYTIVLLFSLQGEHIVEQPATVVRVAVPLVIYFVGMFVLSLGVAKAVGMNYAQSASVAFTAAGNNFELAIAVSIGTFGAMSAQALAGTIGPLVEIPVLVGLVYFILWIGPKLFPGDATLPR